ncbi:MAG: hypothetical protein IPK53_08630 [bacterium]|nr:hypothetical protein [bacterium]
MRCENKYPEVILVAEAFHQRQLPAIAAAIAERRPPSKPGRDLRADIFWQTTFSKRPAVQLLAQGIYLSPLAWTTTLSIEKTPPRRQRRLRL